MTSMWTAWAFFLISASCSLESFLVRTMRFNVGTSLTNFNKINTFSALSTKTVFSEAATQTDIFAIVEEGEHGTYSDWWYERWQVLQVCHRVARRSCYGNDRLTLLSSTEKERTATECYRLMKRRSIILLRRYSSHRFRWRYLVHVFHPVGSVHYRFQLPLFRSESWKSDFYIHRWRISIESYFIVGDPFVVGFSINAITQTFSVT